MSASQTLFTYAFWACLAAVAYAYVGYPLVIWCLSRIFGRRARPLACPDAELPFLSLLIAAHNEEDEIETRLENALAIDYPPDKLEIVVACDGCTDATPAIVRRFEARGVHLLQLARRRGKTAALNAAVPGLRGDVVMLSDANTHTDRDAARMLARWFRDPKVGVVCGRLVLTDPVTGRNVDSLYWKYETFLKKCEGRLGGLLGANGGIYAMRRELFAPVPDDTLIEDLVIPLDARIRTGCALVYEPGAVAREETPADVAAEFQRRSRIGAGGFQCLGRLWPLLDPRQGWVAFTFWSHKVARWLCPFALVGLLVSNLALAGEAFYYAVILAQAGFYATALTAGRLPGQSRAVRLLRLTTMFTAMNTALLAGFWRWARGTQKAAWVRTPRLAGATASGTAAGTTAVWPSRPRRPWFSRVGSRAGRSARPV
jgi:cellulose synthase/poly-beta-1,6-N-acetylglucosamine synthase-like glycosyltransferase